MKNTNKVNPTPVKDVKTVTNTKSNLKGTIKGKEPPQPIVEVKPPPIKEKILERFIHVTNYNDTQTMSTLKELFETINQQAFNLKSPKEIYHKILQEEQDDTYLDYISGFQLIDSNIRITVLEGISTKSMKLVKEKLPKIEMNNAQKMIFSNSKFLFDTRLYNNFGICLKFIKLRDTLSHILTTYDIYSKANKYREIYNAFMNMGFILKSDNFEEIVNANLFPSSESLLMLERKYANILNNEDLTGVKSEEKSKKHRIKKENYSEGSKTALNTLTTLNTSNSSKDDIKSPPKSALKSTKSKMSKDNNHLQEEYNNLRPRLDSHNIRFIEIKKSKGNEVFDSHQKNLDLIKRLNERANTNHFCLKEEHKNYENNYSTKLSKLSHSGSNIVSANNKEVYIYSTQKKNYYADYFDKLREDYVKDKNSFYTYSHDHLSLSFPMIKNSNLKHDEYLENKSVFIYNNFRNGIIQKEKILIVTNSLKGNLYISLK